MASRSGVALTVGVLLVSALLLWYVRSPWRGLPYEDSFAKGRTDGWVAYSGNWRLIDGGVKNDSIDPGAKFIKGSSHWDNYSVESDVELLGNGDAGIVIRASDIESGADSYRGYYAGLRTRDQKLVLGRSDHGWTEFPSKKMPGGVTPGRWYHIKLSAYGCAISASAIELGTDNRQTVTANDPECFSSGKFGLRSLYAGGIWRKVHVARLKQPDQWMAAETAPFPGQGASSVDQASAQTPSVPFAIGQPADDLTYSGPVQSIRDLRLLSTARPARVLVRGSVIVTEPLYVQDANGGVLIELKSKARLRAGEEVEVEGDVYLDGLAATIRNATVRSIAGGIATKPPLSVTAAQASTGAYHAMFVEVVGTLSEKVKLPNGMLSLELRDGPQSFRALANSASIAQSFGHLAKGSVLTLRGVCLVNGEYTQDRVPFALLVISKDDIKVLAGPPWSVEHMIGFAVIMLGLGFVAHFLYSRAEQWRLRAVIDERERLAHEIHDTLAQSFAGIGFQLRAILNRLSKNKNSLNAAWLIEELNRTCELVRRSHDEARRSITTLRPDATEAGGLIAALEQAAHQMVGRAPVLVETSVEGEHRFIPLRVLDSLFRIGQESIANAVQHGRPSKLRICATYSPSAITLLIEDNGAGFDPEPDTDGFGLTGIRRRTENIKGTLAIETAPGTGTRILVMAPMPEKLHQFSIFAHHGKANDGKKDKHARVDSE